jgi:hypothetical protein
MTLHIETPPLPYLYPDGFKELDEIYARNRPTSEYLAAFGSYALADAILLDTPAEVLASGEIVTNPSQLETVTIPVGNEMLSAPFAYFRREPTTLHLGKTTSVPYLLRQNGRNAPHLSEFTEAKTLPGEDPRIMRGVKLPGLNGKVHTGWCVSTVIATPKPDNPADVERIKQVFFWGKTLASLEPILEIPDLKNTCIYPLSKVTRDASDTRLDVFGRPHPHITHAQVSDPRKITKELVLSGTNLTKVFLPSGVHTGVNTVKGVPSYPNHRELDIHEAYAPMTPEGKILHYRLGRYVVDLSTGGLVPLGVTATRADFPAASPKPPENGVANYYDVVYGSLGNPKLGLMVTGVSDRRIGLARVARIR